MTRLLLHVGTEKTGSTSIQRLLSINCQSLLSMGYYVPEFLGTNDKNNHYILAMLCYDSDREDHLTRQYPMFTYNHSLFVQSYFSLIEEALLNFSNYTWLISSEFIQSRLTKQSELLRLSQILNKYFENYMILSYHRHPLALSLSLWSTSLKFGNIQSSPPLPEDLYFDNIANPMNTYERFNGLFPSQYMRFKIYESSVEVSGSIVIDYIKTFGLPLKYLSIPSKSHNPSITVSGINALIAFNHMFPEFRFRSISRVRKVCSKFVLFLFNRGNKYLPAPSYSSLICDHYRNDMLDFLYVNDLSFDNWDTRIYSSSDISRSQARSWFQFLLLCPIIFAMFIPLSVLNVLLIALNRILRK